MFHEILERSVTAAHPRRWRREHVARPVVRIRASLRSAPLNAFSLSRHAVTPTAEVSVFSRVVHTYAIHTVLSNSHHTMCVFARRSTRMSYTRFLWTSFHVDREIYVVRPRGPLLVSIRSNPTPTVGSVSTLRVVWMFLFDIKYLYGFSRSGGKRPFLSSHGELSVIRVNRSYQSTVQVGFW